VVPVTYAAVMVNAKMGSMGLESVFANPVLRATLANGANMEGTRVFYFFGNVKRSVSNQDFSRLGKRWKK